MVYKLSSAVNIQFNTTHSTSGIEAVEQGWRVHVQTLQHRYCLVH